MQDMHPIPHEQIRRTMPRSLDCQQVVLQVEFLCIYGAGATGYQNILVSIFKRLAESSKQPFTLRQVGKINSKNKST